MFKRIVKVVGLVYVGTLVQTFITEFNKARETDDQLARIIDEELARMAHEYKLANGRDAYTEGNAS